MLIGLLLFDPRFTVSNNIRDFWKELRGDLRKTIFLIKKYNELDKLFKTSQNKTWQVLNDG